MTVLICAAVIPLGLAGGSCRRRSASSSRAALAAGGRRSAFVDLFRAIPPLVLLIFVYAGLPFAGASGSSPFTAVVIAFLLNNSAYYGEVFRAGILSVGAGQSGGGAVDRPDPRARRSTHVVLPQAVRNVLPDLISNTVEVVKLTSLASVVSLGELLHAADLARSITYNASPHNAGGAGLSGPCSGLSVRLVSRWQRRIAV